MKSANEVRFLELLEKSPLTEEEFQEEEKARDLFVEELRTETASLLGELKSVGIICISVWDLVNTRQRYPEAIDILIKHLSINYHERNKEGIIRALTVKEARGKATKALIEEYNKTPIEEMNYRWVIGNAVNITATAQDYDSILKIVLDKKNGWSRGMFVAALGRLRGKEVEDLMITLLDDEDVKFEAVRILGKMKSVKAIEKIRFLTHYPVRELRILAIRALKKIEATK